MATTLSSKETYDAISQGEVARLSPRDVVLVSGPDAKSYLQGQVTQDLEGLAAGENIESLLLSPQGKFESYVRIARIEEDRFCVEAAAGQGAVTYERLKRFKLRVKAELELLAYTALEVRGPAAVLPTSLAAGVAYVAAVSWPGLVGYDLVGPDVTVPSDLSLGEDDAFEAARILAGVPVPDAELTEKTIPQEAGIVERTVSFTKGCFTGQELVARLDARGNNVARRLRSLRFPVGAVEVGSELSIGDKVIGEVTSLAVLPGASELVGLGYLRRDVELPAVIKAGSVSGEARQLA